MGQAEPGGGLVQALGALGHGHGEDAERQGVMAAYQSVKAWLESQEQSSQMQVDQQGDAGPGDSSEPTLQGDSSVQDAIVLYAARLAYQLSSDRQPAGTCGLPLSAIASVAGSHLFDLFRDWPVVSAKLAPYFEQHLGLTVKQLEGAGNISEHQKLLVSMALLSKKYKDLFNKYMHSLPEHKPIVLKMGWLLYLVLKAKLLPKVPDLVSCMEVLVCVMNVLVSHLEPLPADMVAGPEGATNILAIISDALKADRAHVQHLMLSVNAVFTQQLQSQSRHHAERQDQRAGVQLSCSYFPGLLSDAARMTVLTALLEREYRAHFQRHGEIDEVDMLYMDFARFASPRMTPSAIYRHNPFSQPPGHPDHVGLPRESPKTATAHHKAVQLLGGPQAQAGQRLGPGSFVSSPLSATAGLGVSPMAGGLPSGLHSPLAIAQLGATTNTPISAALGAAAWLRHVTALLQPEPSPLLLKYFAACVPNPGAAIARRVREMTDMVLPSDAQPASAFPMVQPSIAAYRREEAIKLYYHVLELVMASEERVAAAAGHAQAPCYTTLLTSSKLHKGLMVCSLEVVMACYKMVSCPFPKVLEIIKLHAFDLIKIVQTYVRHMPGMPLELKRHLYLMEEKTVEQLAWQAGSSLYPLIITAMGNTGATSSCTTNGTGTTTGATTTATTSASASVTTTGVTAAPSSSQGGPTTTASAASTHPSTASAARMETAPGSEDTASQAAASTAVPVGAAPAAAGAGTDGAAAQPAAGPAAAGHGDAANAAAAAGSHGPAPSPSKRHASSTHSLMSPLKKARGSDSSAITTQAAPQLMEPLPAAVGRPPPPGVLSTLHPETAAALTWLHDFLRKVLKLAWFRLGFLCQSLHFGGQEAAVVRQKVYDTVEHALYMHTNLLYNRHLDQLLLSALYGYCKVQHLGTITFKEIIAQYRRQPQATQAVFRSVVLAQTNPGLQVQSRGDIIAYYNQAFVPLMKQYLLRGEAAAHPGLGLPPIPPSLPPRQSASPRFGPQGAGPGGASPRLFQAPGSGAASPVGSPCPQGRPPLPPQQCDVVAVNQSIKQTISGFFPALPRGNGAGGKNCLPLSHMSPKTQEPGAAAVKPMHGPPPRWGAPNGKAPAAGGLPCMPAAPLPEPQPIPPQQMPSGLATLLRALDTANGVHMADEEEEGGRESSQEEGTVRAPPQHSPLSGGHGVARAGRDAKVGEGAACASPLSCVVERMRGGPGAAEAAAGVAGQQGSVSPDAASSDTRGALQVL